MAFDQFLGYQPDQQPSIYDVQRRQKLADALLSNQLSGAAMSSPLSAIANTLSGAASGWENTQAAQEAQAGRSQSNDLLSQALTGGNIDPQELMKAAGGGFMDPAQSDIATALMKKKYQLGESFGYTPIPYKLHGDAPGAVHYALPGSMGDVRNLEAPGGGEWAPQVNMLNTGTGYQGVTKSGEVVGAPVEINNAQPALDKAWGEALGKDWAAAPATLQKEGNMVKSQVMEHDLVSGKIDTAINQIDSNPNITTGLVGDLFSAVKGTPQYDLAQNLETIKANIGFDQIQNMKDNSQSGSSGLGAISNMEEELLQAINGSLAPGQSAAQLKGNLEQIKQRIAAITAAKQAAVLQDIERYKRGPQASPTLGGGPVSISGQDAMTAAPGATKTYTWNPATGQLE